MGRSLIAVLVAVGVLGGPNVSVVKAEVTAVADEGFPLPKDAVPQYDATSKTTKPSPPSKSPAKSTGNRIRTYDVPRSREAVVTETRTALKARKWEIVKDEPSPSGNVVRLTVKNSGKTWKASFTGDDTRAVIILTAPAS